MNVWSCLLAIQVFNFLVPWELLPPCQAVFLCVLFFRGHLPRSSSFRSAKQMLVASFARQDRACILSDHNIFYNPRGGRTTAGHNAPGAFLVSQIISWLVKAGAYKLLRKLYDFKTSMAGKRGRNLEPDWLLEVIIHCYSSWRRRTGLFPRAKKKIQMCKDCRWVLLSKFTLEITGAHKSYITVVVT